MSVHRIRLRGPWEVTAITPAVGSPVGVSRMPCPCTWKEGGWTGFSGSAGHSRRFGRPRQIDDGERIWLVVDPCTCEQLSIALNGAALGIAIHGTYFEADITERIAERNELMIDLWGKSDECGLTGEVRLEIRS